MLWFSGITWETPVRDIGWTWVLLGVLLICLVRATLTLLDALLDGGQ